MLKYTDARRYTVWPSSESSKKNEPVETFCFGFILFLTILFLTEVKAGIFGKNFSFSLIRCSVDTATLGAVVGGATFALFATARRRAKPVLSSLDDITFKNGKGGGQPVILILVSPKKSAVQLYSRCTRPGRVVQFKLTRS